MAFVGGRLAVFFFGAQAKLVQISRDQWDVDIPFSFQRKARGQREWMGPDKLSFGSR